MCLTRSNLIAKQNSGALLSRSSSSSLLRHPLTLISTPWTLTVNMVRTRDAMVSQEFIFLPGESLLRREDLLEIWLVGVKLLIVTSCIVDFLGGYDTAHLTYPNVESTLIWTHLLLVGESKVACPKTRLKMQGFCYLEHHRKTTPEADPTT